jgi:glycosyltransferase involved in cell wall biosynthesis
MRLGIAAGARERCGVGDLARGLAAAYPFDIEVLWLDYPAGDTRAAWRRAARAADGLDVVHVHYEYGLFRTVKPYRNRYAAFLGRLRPPVVVTLHGPLPELEPRWRSGRRRVADLLRDLAYLPFFAQWERVMHRGAAHWIVHGRGLCDRIEPVVGAERSTYLPHPIPEVAQRWQPSTREMPMMVTPGFIKPHKGYNELVQALAAHQSWSWIIAGGPQDRRDHEYVRRLEDALADGRLEDRVCITGYLDRPEMEAAMCGAHLAVFPYAEVVGSGSVAWAIGCGMPVVTTDLPEFRSMRSSGAGIELLPVGTPDRWLEIILRLWREPARLEGLGQKNREYAAANGYDRCAMAHAEIFARVAREDGT